MTWNIRFGGLFGKTDYSDRILDYFHIQNDTDLFILTEYQQHSAGIKIADTLQRTGWPYQVSSVPQGEEPGVLIASRFPVEQLPGFEDFDAEAYTPVLRYGVVIARVVPHDLHVLGVYMPREEGRAKEELWKHLLAYVRQFQGRLVLAGDLNSFLARDSEQSVESSALELNALRGMLVDAWEASDSQNITSKDRFTWYGTKAGQRLDYVFVSPGLQVIFAKHAHVAREQQVSDHSAVLVKLGF